jgi:adhesin/invasin
VTDSGGNKVTRAPVALTSSATGKASFATGAVATGITGNTGLSVDGGSAGIASFAVVCAGTSTGTATITASVNAGGDTSTQDVTVVGGPSAVALTAAPASIDCNGTSTATVTAKVTDSAGNNVADGTSVTFSVVALGTANPITAKTTAGTATTTITPLSANVAGVTVNVTAGSAQSSILVSCNLPTPTAPAGPGATATPPGGVIGGPNTGTGGYLGQDGSSSFPMWAILALAAGSLVLFGGGVVARRAGK